MRETTLTFSGQMFQVPNHKVSCYHFQNRSAFCKSFMLQIIQVGRCLSNNFAKVIMYSFLIIFHNQTNLTGVV